MSNQTLPQPAAYVEREFNDQAIHQRSEDGYLNATAMCRACQKEWSNYFKNQSAQDFVAALESDLRIRRSELIQKC